MHDACGRRKPKQPRSHFKLLDFFDVGERLLQTNMPLYWIVGALIPVQSVSAGQGSFVNGDGSLERFPPEAPGSRFAVQMLAEVITGHPTPTNAAPLLQTDDVVRHQEPRRGE